MLDDREERVKPSGARSAVEALVMGAEVLAGVGKYSEARRQLDVALRADPGNTRATALLDSMREAEVGPLLGEAGGHFLSDRLVEAEALLLRVLDIDPRHDRASRMLRSIRARKAGTIHPPDVGAPGVRRDGAELGATGQRESASKVQAEEEPIESITSWIVHEEAESDLETAESDRSGPETQPIDSEPLETQPIDLGVNGPPDDRMTSEETMRAAASSPRPLGERLREFDWPMALGLVAMLLALVLVVALRPKRAAEAVEEVETATLVGREGAGRGAEGEREREPAGRSVGGAPQDGLLSATDRNVEDAGVLDEVDPDSLTVPRVARGVVEGRAESVDLAEPSDPSASRSYFEEVAVLVAGARSAHATGDWEGSIETAERAREIAPQSSLVLEVSAEIHAAARSAAASAQHAAETVGASTASPDAFGDAVERLADGNRESATSPLVAARSYREAADLFRRSSEKARLRGLRMALDEYAAAHRTLDLERLVALWPSLSGDSYEATADWFAAAKSVLIEVNDCRMTLSATGGAADCRVSQDYIPIRGSRHSVSSRRRFDLERQGSRWQLNGVYSAAP